MTSSEREFTVQQAALAWLWRPHSLKGNMLTPYVPVLGLDTSQADVFLPCPDKQRPLIGIAESREQGLDLTEAGLACLHSLWLAYRQRGTKVNFRIYTIEAVEDAARLLRLAMEAAARNDILFFLGVDTSCCLAVRDALRHGDGDGQCSF